MARYSTVRQYKLNSNETWNHKLKIKLSQKLQESLKSILQQEFLDKITDKAVKCLKLLAIPELKSKGKKIRFEANKTILKRIDEVNKATERGNVDRYQEKLQEGKKFPLKQQKLIRIAEEEEDGLKVVKCYLQDDLASFLNGEWPSGLSGLNESGLVG